LSRSLAALLMTTDDGSHAIVLMIGMMSIHPQTREGDAKAWNEERGLRIERVDDDVLSPSTHNHTTTKHLLSLVILKFSSLLLDHSFGHVRKS
jgi:hypothetical protein